MTNILTLSLKVEVVTIGPAIKRTKSHKAHKVYNVLFTFFREGVGVGGCI